MAEGTSRVRALFEPFGAAVKSYLTGESCPNFATRKVAENANLLSSKQISPAQAKDYLTMLQQITQISGGRACSTIVAVATVALDTQIVKR